MSKLTLPIEVGKRYVRRDGQIVTAAPNDNNTFGAHLIDVRTDAQRQDCQNSVSWCLAFPNTGCIGAYKNMEHEFDLIEDAPLLTLPLVVGRKYIRRDGKVITAQFHNNCRSGLVFVGHGIEPHTAENIAHESHGRIFNDSQCSRDIVADYVEPVKADPARVGPHPHAALMADYADDAKEIGDPWVRWQFEDGHGWQQCTEHPSWVIENKYRRIRKTIRIGEFDVPEPVRRPLADDQTYYFANLGTGAIEAKWGGIGSHDMNRLQQGRIHMKREDANLHAKAILSFTELK